MLSGRPQKQLRVKLPPLLSSDSIGCFRAVMSLKVSRNSTTRSRSFFMGAIWSSSHSGVSAHTETSSLKIYAVLCTASTGYSCNKSCITLRRKKKIGGIVEKLSVALLIPNPPPPFTDPKDSLLYLQTPSTNPDPEPDESNPQTSHIHKTHFIVRLFLQVPGFSKYHLPFKFTSQNFVCISHFPTEGYISCYSHPSCFRHQNIWRRVSYKSGGPSLCIFNTARSNF